MCFPNGLAQRFWFMLLEHNRVKYFFRLIIYIEPGSKKSSKDSDLHRQKSFLLLGEALNMFFALDAMAPIAATLVTLAAED